MVSGSPKIAKKSTIFWPPKQKSWRIFRRFFSKCLKSKVVSTHLWNTPETFTKRLKRDFYHNWLGGLPGVWCRGVLKQSLIKRSACWMGL